MEEKSLDYKKGYSDGYEACREEYSNRDRRLLVRTNSCEKNFILYRSQFMDNYMIRGNRDFKNFIDSHIFKNNVKNARKNVEVLQMGKWYKIYETGLIFNLDDLEEEYKDFSIEDKISQYLVKYFRTEYSKENI